MKKPHILHLHSTFSAGGKELRCVQLINAFGPGVEHSIVSADPARIEAARLISPKITVHCPAKFPSLMGKPSPRRQYGIAKAMKPFDLVLTYNWGSMDAPMAHTLFEQALGLPPLIHHEDGFNEDEQVKLNWKRNWWRRIGLGRASALVVPSERLEEIALDIWQQPLGRVKNIPNGIDVKAFSKKPKEDALRGVIKRKGEKWVGTLAGLRPVKNLPAMVRAFSKLPDPWQLVIVGDGPEKETILNEAGRLNISHRVHLPGFAPNPANYVGLFDIFALSSLSEQFPISLIEAMAAGLPIATPAVGDIANMVSEANEPYIVPAGDEEALGWALEALGNDEKGAKAVGEANRLKALANYEEKVMIDTYRRLYANAMGRKSLP